MPARVTGQFSTPDRLRETGGVRQEIVQFGDATIARMTHPVGWRWSVDVRPIVGTSSCQARHVGVILSGRLGVQLDDGSAWEVNPGEPFDFPPGHDGYVIGDEPVVAIEWVGVPNWAEPRQSARALVALLFTDIVGSTSALTALGDRAWRARLEAHNEVVRHVLADNEGTEVATTGDGFFAYFFGPAQALAAALAIRESMAPVGLAVRQGVHVGEVHIGEEDVTGLAVHEAARIAAAADAGEILVSQITRVLAAPSGYTFASRGTFALKGLEGDYELFALK